MTLARRFREFALERLQARNRFRTYRIIQSLPKEIQKDIGWPDGLNARRFRDERHGR